MLGQKGFDSYLLAAHGLPGQRITLFFLTMWYKGDPFGLGHNITDIVPDGFPLDRLNVFSCHDKGLPDHVKNVFISKIALGNNAFNPLGGPGTHGALDIAGPFKKLLLGFCCGNGQQ